MYGIGLALMLLAMKFGDLSILHPMLSAGFILSLFLGHFILREQITLQQIAGVGIIGAGMVLLAMDGRRRV